MLKNLFFALLLLVSIQLKNSIDNKATAATKKFLKANRYVCKKILDLFLNIKQCITQTIIGE